MRRSRPTASAAAASAAAVAALLAIPASGATHGISVPPGFRVETFARGLNQPTAMAYGPDNRIYVTQNGGEIVRISAAPDGRPCSCAVSAFRSV